jgi:hypothetical protein
MGHFYYMETHLLKDDRIWDCGMIFVWIEEEARILRESSNIFKECFNQLIAL